MLFKEKTFNYFYLWVIGKNESIKPLTKTIIENAKTPSSDEIENLCYKMLKEPKACKKVIYNYGYNFKAFIVDVIALAEALQS